MMFSEAMSRCGDVCCLLFTPMRRKGIGKLEGGLILNPYREITGGNRAINMLIITLFHLILTETQWINGQV